MYKLILFCFYLSAQCFFFLSCQPSKGDLIALNPVDTYLTFQLNPQTSLFIKSLFPYVDENGREYLTFQNNIEPEILVYDMNTQKHIKTIMLEKEGANGVGLFCGYYIHSWNEIYIPCTMKSEICIVDSNGLISRKIFYPENAQKKLTVPLIALSFPYTPMYMIAQKIYIPQLPNPSYGERIMEDSPVALLLDTVKNELEELPLRFPPIMDSERIRGNTLGIETNYSSFYDGSRFVYSFFFDESIYVVSLEGELKQKIKVKSKHLDKLCVLDKFPNDFVKALCEIPCYGNLVYDKYRDVYYRFVYPKTELNSHENYMDIWQLGRTKFSIIILNKDFEILGETLFPENTYASNHFLIREDGLYLSTSFIKNPHFSDDELRFQRIELVGNVQ